MRFVLPALCLASLALASSASRSASAARRSTTTRPGSRRRRIRRARQKHLTVPTRRAIPRCAAAGNAEPGEIEYGVGVRLRSVWIPQWGARPLRRPRGGRRAELRARRRSDPPPRHDRAPARVRVRAHQHRPGCVDQPQRRCREGERSDYVLGPDERTGSGKQFGWFTMEFTFLNHAEINRWAVGALRRRPRSGGPDRRARHYNIICGPGATTPCPSRAASAAVPGHRELQRGHRDAGEVRPRHAVFPVVNAILGLQFRPSDRVTIQPRGRDPHAAVLRDLVVDVLLIERGARARRGDF